MLALRILLALLFIIGAPSIEAGWLPLVKAGGGGGGYQGLGDLSLGTIRMYWGFRCYTKTGTNKLFTVLDDATGTVTTDVKCDGNGGYNTSTPTPIATTCGTACHVSVIYDQTNGTYCGGAPCDASAHNVAGITNNFTLNCQNGRPCMTCVNSTNGVYENLSTMTSLSQPLSVMFVGTRTANTSAFNTVIAVGSNGATQTGFSDSANNDLMFAGTVVSQAGADAGTKVLAFYNGASSKFCVNGSCSTVNPNTNNPGTGGPQVCGLSISASGNNVTGRFYEGFVTDNDQSANASTIATNQASATSGWNF